MFDLEWEYEKSEEREELSNDIEKENASYGNEEENAASLVIKIRNKKSIMVDE